MEQRIDFDHVLTSAVAACRAGTPLRTATNDAARAAGDTPALLALLDSCVTELAPQAVCDATAWAAECAAAAGDLDSFGLSDAAGAFWEAHLAAEVDAALAVLDAVDQLEGSCFSGFAPGEVPAAAADLAWRAAAGHADAVSGVHGNAILLAAAGLALLAVADT